MEASGNSSRRGAVAECIQTRSGEGWWERQKIKQEMETELAAGVTRNKYETARDIISWLTSVMLSGGTYPLSLNWKNKRRKGARVKSHIDIGIAEGRPRSLPW